MVVSDVVEQLAPNQADLTMRRSGQIDGLVQERRNSSALAMELRLSCINPSKWTTHS